MSYTCTPSGMKETEIVCIVSDSSLVSNKVLDPDVLKIAVKRPGGAICFHVKTTNNTNYVEFIDFIGDTPPTDTGETWTDELPDDYNDFDCQDENKNQLVIITKNGYTKP